MIYSRLGQWMPDMPKLFQYLFFIFPPSHEIIFHFWPRISFFPHCCFHEKMLHWFQAFCWFFFILRLFGKYWFYPFFFFFNTAKRSKLYLCSILIELHPFTIIYTTVNLIFFPSLRIFFFCVFRTDFWGRHLRLLQRQQQQKTSLLENLPPPLSEACVETSLPHHPTHLLTTHFSGFFCCCARGSGGGGCWRIVVFCVFFLCILRFRFLNTILKNSFFVFRLFFTKIYSRVWWECGTFHLVCWSTGEREKRERPFFCRRRCYYIIMTIIKIAAV